jgi:hypothetical protein
VPSGWVPSLAWSLSIESGDEGCSAWSSGPRSVGCISWRGWGSGRFGGGRGCTGRRSAARWCRRRRPAMRECRGGRSSIRSGRRSTRCCAGILRSRASGSASCCASRGSTAARRSPMTMCGRCAGSFWISGPISGPCTGRGMWPSSICGSPSVRSRLAMGRRARGMWSSACWGSRGWARGRWCSPRRRRTCCGGCGGAWGGSARCRGGWWSTGRGVCMPVGAVRRTSSPRLRAAIGGLADPRPAGL